MPRLLKEPDAQGKFLQQIFDDIGTNEEDLQIEAAKSFTKVIHEKVIYEKLKEKKLLKKIKDP